MFKVRAARASDAPDLLHSALGNALESEGLKLDEAVAKNGVGALLADSHKGRVFVAEEAGRFVGSTYVTFEWSDWHASWYWWIQSAYVVPERRGSGVWSALYRHVLDVARKEGNVRSIRLYVESHNEAGLRAYKGHGMAELPYKVFEQTL